MITLVEFSMNYKLCEICNNIQSYQNTNKIHNSFKQPIFFGAVCIAFECCKCARMRFHCATVGGPEYLHTLEGTLLTMQCKWTFTIRLIFSTLQENAPCYGNNHKKNASLAAIVRYINIKTIYTVGYLQIFNAGHFYSSKHCHDLWRKKHWIHGFQRNHKL